MGMGDFLQVLLGGVQGGADKYMSNAADKEKKARDLLEEQAKEEALRKKGQADIVKQLIVERAKAQMTPGKYNQNPNFGIDLAQLDPNSPSNEFFSKIGTVFNKPVSAPKSIRRSGGTSTKPARTGIFGGPSALTF